MYDELWSLCPTSASIYDNIYFKCCFVLAPTIRVVNMSRTKMKDQKIIEFRKKARFLEINERNKVMHKSVSPLRVYLWNLCKLHVAIFNLRKKCSFMKTKSNVVWMYPFCSECLISIIFFFWRIYFFLSEFPIKMLKNICSYRFLQSKFVRKKYIPVIG